MKRCLSFILASAALAVAACDKAEPAPEPTPEPQPEEKVLTYEDTGLPIIYLMTSDCYPIKSKEDYKTAGIKIVIPEGIEGMEGLDSTTCLVKGHGNSTWQYDKKPYLVKFDSRTEVLGMPKHKRWVLLANYLDKTLMRNSVAYRISSLTSLEYTPRSVQCELVLNCTPMGTYQLIEQVRVDENRLDIDEETGYLFELDGHYNNDVQWMDPHGKASLSKFDGQGIPFSIKNPDPDIITDEQIRWGKNYIYKTAESVYGGDLSGLDLQSFADYFIVFESTINHELGGPCSVFMYKETDGLLTAGPAWDFDWGTFSYVGHSRAKTGFLNNSAIWYAALLQNPEFQKVLKERWTVLYPKLESEIPPYIEEQRRLLSKTAELNFKKWNPLRKPGGTDPINGDETLSFDDAVDRLKSIYIEHLHVMDSVIRAY